MMKPLLAMSALVLAAPALAQDMTTDPTQPATTTTTPQTTEMAPPVEPTEDAATTATPREAAEAQTNADESEDSMTTTTTESMSDATTTQTTDVDATTTVADQTGVTTEATAATTAQAPVAAPTPTMPAGTAMGGPSNWAEFDANSDGNLTPLEFGKLVMDAKGQPVGAEVDATLRSRDADLPAVQVLNSTSVELARIDSDRNWMVSQAELQAYQPE